jgi:hypothetical protein
MDWQTAFYLLDRLEVLDPMDPQVRRVEFAEMSALTAEERYKRDRRLLALYGDVLKLVDLDDRLRLAAAQSSRRESTRVRSPLRSPR